MNIKGILWWHISVTLLSDNYVDLSDLFVDLSDNYVDLSDLFVVHLFQNSLRPVYAIQFMRYFSDKSIYI